MKLTADDGIYNLWGARVSPNLMKLEQRREDRHVSKDWHVRADWHVREDWQGLCARMTSSNGGATQKAHNNSKFLNPFFGGRGLRRGGGEHRH
jgi:hypothetical protein